MLIKFLKNVKIASTYRYVMVAKKYVQLDF